jgi:hypothetical protein
MNIQAAVLSAFVFGSSAQLANAYVYDCAVQPSTDGWITARYVIGVNNTQKIRVSDSIIGHYIGEPVTADAHEVTDAVLKFGWQVQTTNSKGIPKLVNYRAVVFRDLNEIQVDATISGSSKTRGRRGTCVLAKK